MLQEKVLTSIMRTLNSSKLQFKPTEISHFPPPKKKQSYMLYIHVPFCERLCPYCSFNRFSFDEGKARAYFASLRKEMQMVADQGFKCETLYVGGGTPTILLDELLQTLDKAYELFDIEDASCETNPNHLVPEIVDSLKGKIKRLSVGVQSFNDDLLKQMGRYEKYGSAQEIVERIYYAKDYFQSLNVDMMFNFPSQTEEMLFKDLETVAATGASQTTFYPLMASPSVRDSLRKTVGEVDESREEHFYHIIDEVLCGGANPAYTHSSAWTFNAVENSMIDEYIVNYEEYPAIGSGAMSYLEGNLYVNTFSLKQYGEKIELGMLSAMGENRFLKTDRMRYRFLMQLFGLKLDKKQWESDFGCSVERGLPAEYLFMKLAGAFDVDDDEKITLTPRGRYLLVAMMREFFIGVNSLRDAARSALPEDEREVLFSV